MSRELTSFPIVNPKAFPFALTATVSSGSGTSQFESLRIEIFCRCPTVLDRPPLMKSSGRSAS